MSVFKNIKSLFIIEEAATTPSPTTQPTPVVQTPIAPTAKPNSANSKNVGGASKKFLDVLFAAMEKANIDGFDYMEYKRSLQSLAKIPMDEATRYKSAFAMAQTMGVTPTQLMKAAQFYIEVLGREEVQFEQALEAQKAKQVGNKSRQTQQLEQLIQEKAAQIQQLTEEIGVHQQQLENTHADIATATQKLEETKASFHASYNLMVTQIQTDIDNMKKYLK